MVPLGWGVRATACAPGEGGRFGRPSPVIKKATYIIGLNFSHSDFPLLDGRQMNLQTVHLMRRLPVKVRTGVKKNGS